MNFISGDMADELGVLVGEIADHDRFDSRTVATYVLLSGLNLRRDHYGVAFAIDGSRQTLLHLGHMEEGIAVTADAGGAASGIRIGPHFANDWDMLELARSIGTKPDAEARKAALETVVHQTLVEGETRCWELKPLLAQVAGAATSAVKEQVVLPSPEVLSRVAGVLGGGMETIDVQLCLAALAIVLEDWTQRGGRVEVPHLGSFACQVLPNGVPHLVFRDTYN